LADNVGSSFIKRFSRSLEIKLFKEIPPLKDYPEEIESEDSDLSETLSEAERNRNIGFNV
jgi:hypothetical protein